MKIEVISHTCSTIFWHIDRIFGVFKHALVLVCPTTNTNKEYLFYIELDNRIHATNVILRDQAKMLDVKARNTKFEEKYPEDIRNEPKELGVSFM